MNQRRKIVGRKHYHRQNRPDGSVIRSPLIPIHPPTHGHDPQDEHTSLANTHSANTHTSQSAPLPPPDVEQGHDTYYNRRTDIILQWEGVREQLFDTALQNESQPVGTCVVCDQNPVEVRCPQCGPMYYVCGTCADREHTKRPLHRMEIWMHDNYQCYRPQVLPLISRFDHANCSTINPEKFMIIDDLGCSKEAFVSFCACETKAVTLLRLGLWPSSGNGGRVCFSLQFMSWLQAMVITNHVSVQGFIEAVRWKNEITTSDVRTLYRLLLNETFEEFRFHSHRLRHDLCDVSLTACPVCSECKPDPVMVALDGNFGLVRKKTAGMSHRRAKHGDRMFIEDSTVRNFVNSYGSDQKSVDAECSRFQAGNTIRSKIKAGKLDVTGVFGSVCRHEVPLKFLNMHHGERLAYPILVLQNIMENRPTTGKMFVLYDIACILNRHLQKTADGQTLLGVLKLVVPAFHAYGHTAVCQLQYSPRYTDGIGCVDGEAMERLWSFLRPFGPMTKEMMPEHRIDLLTDALLYHASRKIESLGQMLVDQYEMAKMGYDSSKEQLERLCSEIGTSMNIDLLRSWQAEELQRLTKKKETQNQTGKNRNWEEQYVSDILSHHSLRTQQTSDSGTNEAGVCTRATDMKLLDDKLKATEKIHQIRKRWKSGEKLFDDSKSSLEKRQHSSLLARMLQLARERRFLLNLKKKHENGQEIVQKLSRQINKVVLTIKRNVRAYNLVSTANQITEREAYDTDASIYMTDEVGADQETEAIPFSMKREAIDLMNRMLRTAEEVTLKRREASMMFMEYLRRRDAMLAALQLAQQSQTPSKQGLAVLLQKQGRKLEASCSELRQLFSCMCDIPAFPAYFGINDKSISLNLTNDENNEESCITELLRSDPSSLDSDPEAED